MQSVHFNIDPQTLYVPPNRRNGQQQQEQQQKKNPSFFVPPFTNVLNLSGKPKLSLKLYKKKLEQKNLIHNSLHFWGKQIHKTNSNQAETDNKNNIGKNYIFIFLF